jgi:hypothetical protein
MLGVEAMGIADLAGTDKIVKVAHSFIPMR